MYSSSSVNTLAVSPRHWFRMRDCDALARFTIASALACNDIDFAFSDAQYDMVSYPFPHKQPERNPQRQISCPSPCVDVPYLTL